MARGGLCIIRSDYHTNPKLQLGVDQHGLAMIKRQLMEYLTAAPYFIYT
jgi:hypothetical protein